jgi:hypothetical protein
VIISTRSVRLLILITSAPFESLFYALREGQIPCPIHVTNVTWWNVTPSEQSQHFMEKNCFTFRSLKELHVTRLAASGYLIDRFVFRFRKPYTYFLSRCQGPLYGASLHIHVQVFAPPSLWGQILYRCCVVGKMQSISHYQERNSPIRFIFEINGCKSVFIFFVIFLKFSYIGK